MGVYKYNADSMEGLISNLTDCKNQIDKISQNLTSNHKKLANETGYSIANYKAWMVEENNKLKMQNLHLQTVIDYLKLVQKETVEADRKACNYFDMGVFEKRDRPKKIVDDMVNAGYQKCKNAKNKFSESLKTGKLYKAIQYYKAVKKVVKAGNVIVDSVATIFVTGGISTPLATLAIIYAMNDVTSGLADITALATGQEERVGKTNWLRDQMREGGEAIFGEKGKAVADVIYNTGDFLNSNGEEIDKYIHSNPTSKLKMETVGDVKDNINHMLHTNVKDLKYQEWLWKQYDQNTYTLNDMYKDGKKIKGMVNSVVNYAGVSDKTGISAWEDILGKQVPKEINTIKDIGKFVSSAKKVF